MRYRVTRHSIDGLGSSRRVLLEAAVIEEREGAAVLFVAGEPLLVLPTMDELLRTLDLTPDDLVAE